jgi:hypothetical protein
MRTEGSRLTTYNYIAKKACQTGDVYANEKQLGEVYRLFRISMIMLDDAKFKMDCSFSNQELTDKEIDFALKHIQHV